MVKSHIMPKINRHEPVGFIGLGQMGGRIVKHMISNGLSLIVFDKDKKVLNEFRDIGVNCVTNPSEVVEQVSILFLCLPFTNHVEDVLFGKFGAVKKSRPGLLVLDMSTIFFDDAQRISIKLKRHKISYCDCPVSGLPARARSGTLTIMYGGSQKAYDQALPYLNIIGDFIVYCGDCGSGQMMKAFNNIVYNINIAGVSEMLSLAIKVGLDTKALGRVFTSGSSRSFASEHFVSKMLENNFTGDYPMKAAIKDIMNVQKALSGILEEKPLFEGMIKIYDEAMSKGWGKKSKSAMFEVYQEKYRLASKKKG